VKIKLERPLLVDYR